MGTHKQGNFNGIIPKIKFNQEYNFEFGDIINNGFTINEFYIGDGTPIGKPNINITAIGFTKNNGNFPKGASVWIDPSIAFDTSNSAGNSGSTVTIPSFTVGTGTDKILLVSVGLRGGQTVNGIDFNSGESFTFVAEINSSADVTKSRIELWKLVNPTSATADIVVTLSATPTSAVAGAVSLFNVDQSNPIPTISKSDVSGSPISTSITTAYDNSWIWDSIHSKVSNADFVVNSSQIERWNQAGGFSTSSAGSTKSTLTAGTYSMGWSVGGTLSTMTHLLAEIKESTGGGADTTPPTYTGAQINQTIAGQEAEFALNVSDETNLTDGRFIFSTNNTGSWVNDSFVAFTNTLSEWANVTKVLNSTVGTNIGYRWYLNDTAGNTNSTSIYEVLTTSAGGGGDCWSYNSGTKMLIIPSGCQYFGSGILGI